jgi:HEAT repeat protein
MASLKRAAFLLSLVVAVDACGWQTRRNEPTYQGRSASDWIGSLGQTHVPNEWGLSRGKPAEDALRAMGPAAIPSCIEALGHKDWFVRAGGAHALGLYGADAKSAVPALAAAVTDRDGLVRRLAVESLFKIGDAEAAIPVLSEQLSHQDPVIRVGVASTLARIDPGQDDAYRVLIDGLQYVDTEFRNAVNAWGPNEHKYDRAMEVQKDGRRFFNREDEGRAAAATQLGVLGPDAKRAIPQLIAAHRNRHYYAAPAAAALALGEIGPDARAAVPALLETLSSVERRHSERAASPGLVRVTCTALGKIGLTAADLPPLYRMLESPHTSFDAIPLAFAGAPPEAVRGLFDRMSSSDAFTARRATQALGTMGPRAQAGIPVLLAALRHEDPLVRMHAATALGAISISDTGGISALRGLLDDPDQRVRSAASNSLAKLSTDHRRPAPPK